VKGLEISGCRIENVVPTIELAGQSGLIPATGAAILVTADPHPPSMANPGKPGNFSGTIKILNNTVDVGGLAGTLDLGIVLFAVGRSPDQEVDVTISANKVVNVTEPAINLRLIGGRVLAEWNTITTGSVPGVAANPDAFRITGSGSFLIAHNSIDCGWPEPTATGINLFGQSATQPPVTDAIVVDNDVIMSAPEGIKFAANSAAIEIGGRAQGNMILNNRIHGRAGAALSVIGRASVTPGNNKLVSNDLQDFQSSLAGVFVDAGVTNTLVVGRPSSLQDNGAGTIIVPTL
jgi:hypothetical protein